MEELILTLLTRWFVQLSICWHQTILNRCMKQKNKYGMPPPTCRAEFEHNVFLLADDMERHMDDVSYLRNRIWALGDSLERLRYLPNRRIELPAIDERVRNLSNMMDWMKYMPPMEIKKKKEKASDKKEESIEL